MRIGKRFLRDERGTTFEGIALSVSIIAVAFVASADMLDYMVKARHPSPVGEFATAPHQAPPSRAGDALVARNGDVDYTPTASLPNSLPRLITRSVLDPCTGAVK